MANIEGAHTNYNRLLIKRRRSCSYYIKGVLKRLTLLHFIAYNFSRWFSRRALIFPIHHLPMTLLPPLTSKCAPPSPNRLPPPQSSRFHGDCTAPVPRKGHKFTQSYAFLFTSDPWSVSVYVCSKNPNQFQKIQIKISLAVSFISYSLVNYCFLYDFKNNFKPHLYKYLHSKNKRDFNGYCLK